MFQVAADSERVVRLYKITMQPLSLVMELMPNGSLYELLQNNRDNPLDWGIRYRLAMDISTGLEDIHSHRVLHRDLKSLNVLLDGNLRAKLTDFGLATTKPASTLHSSVQGTAHWMAPEVANGEPDSQGSDVYSLGMVFWELLTHRQPYANLRPIQVLGQVMQGKQETIPADCPPTFKQLILDCWTVAEKRPKAADVTVRLRPMLDSKDTPATPAAGGVLNSFASRQLNGGAGYQIDAAPHATHRSAVLHQTSSLVSSVSPSVSHSQPQSPTPSTPVEEKAAAQGNVRPEAQLIDAAPHATHRSAVLRQTSASLVSTVSSSASRSQPQSPPSSTPAINTSSSFFATGNPSRPDNKVETKQAVNNPPQVTPNPISENSAAPVVVDEKALGQLLKCVAEGEQDQAEALIKKDSKLLLVAGKVTDLSGRTFDNITAFQYALWAIDYHMWTMIQKHLPAEAQAKQHALLESKGTAHGKHFDLQLLLEALKTYVDNAQKWNYDQRAKDHWCKKVGGAQKLLPAHVVNEYCRPDRPFDPCPAEWTSALPRTRTAEIWDGSKYVKGSSWFAAPQLGVSFAFYRCGRGGVSPLRAGGLGDGGAGYAVVRALWGDLKSLQALWNARTKQLKLLTAQPTLISTPVAEAKPLEQLLKFVAEGEQDQAEALIKKDSKLLLAAGKVTDLSGRTFDNITAFQYALWAMDYHMWTMIQKYLPTEAQAKQHALLESKGTAHGKRFDLQPLLAALKTYVDNAEKWNYDQRAKDQWCKKVGGAQKLLPAHVVNEYCRPDRPFYPCPTEWTSTLPRTRSVADVWDGSKYVSGGSWFAAPQLGVTFAFYRWREGAGWAAGWGHSGVGRGGSLPPCDLKSLQALWNARTEQLKLLADIFVMDSQSPMWVGLK